jgi:hypothetical protein
VTHVKCPVCASENVYSLLNTLRCKRCGNIWKEDKKTRSNYDTREFQTPISNRRQIKVITDSVEKKMEKQLDGYLKKFNGKFSMYTVTPNIGDIYMAMFRRYLKKCVRNRTLVEKKDRYGILWYSRPD